MSKILLNLSGSSRRSDAFFVQHDAQGRRYIKVKTGDVVNKFWLTASPVTFKQEVLAKSAFYQATSDKFLSNDAAAWIEKNCELASTDESLSEAMQYKLGIYLNPHGGKWMLSKYSTRACEYLAKPLAGTPGHGTYLHSEDDIADWIRMYDLRYRGPKQFYDESESAMKASSLIERAVKGESSDTLVESVSVLNFDPRYGQNRQVTVHAQNRRAEDAVDPWMPAGSHESTPQKGEPPYMLNPDSVKEMIERVVRGESTFSVIESSLGEKRRVKPTIRGPHVRKPRLTWVRTR